MKCPDCKGSGKYVGAFVVEDCHKCNGAGHIVTDEDKARLLKSLAESQPQKIIGEVEIYEYVKSVGEPGTNPFDLARKYDKVSELKPARNSVEELELAPCDGINLPEIQVGTIIHVFDAGWYEAEVTNIYVHQGAGALCGERMLRADYACGHFRILLQLLSYNVTQGRWEYIKAGTPTYP